MDFFNKREDRRPPVANRQARLAEGHPEPAGPIEDELGLFGLGYDQNDDQLRRLDLSGKPEDDFSCDPRHFHHDVL
jgi:hypothetical protein